MPKRGKGRIIQAGYSGSEPLVAMTARVPRSLLKRMRLVCLKQGQQMQDFVAEAFREYLRRRLRRPAASRPT